MRDPLMWPIRRYTGPQRKFVWSWDLLITVGLPVAAGVVALFIAWLLFLEIPRWHAESEAEDAEIAALVGQPLATIELRYGPARRNFEGVQEPYTDHWDRAYTLEGSGITDLVIRLDEKRVVTAAELVLNENF